MVQLAIVLVTLLPHLEPMEKFDLVQLGPGPVAYLQADHPVLKLCSLLWRAHTYRVSVDVDEAGETNGPEVTARFVISASCCLASQFMKRFHAVLCSTVRADLSMSLIMGCILWPTS